MYAWTLVTTAGTMTVALVVPATGWVVFISVFGFLMLMLGLHVLVRRLLGARR